MASINLGKIAFKWQGAYAVGTTYASQDVVSFNGDSFVCLADGTIGVEPVAGASWALFAQGTTGVSAVAGEVIYNDGTGLVALPAGTSGQVLAISPVTALPVWADPDVRSSTRVKALPVSSSRGQQSYSYRFHGCIMNDDSVRIWGQNSTYKLGDGTTFDRSYPQRPGFPPGFPGAAKLFLGYNSTNFCIDKNGQFWTWGDNAYGQIGNGTTTVQRIPYNASANELNSINGRTIVDVATLNGPHNFMSIMLLDSTGDLHSCGYNAHGQLGLGDTVNRNNFNRLTAVSDVAYIAGTAERYTSYYAVKTNGELYSWGYNAQGQLGTGTTAQSNIPTLRNLGSIAGKTIARVYGGYECSYVLDTDNVLHSTGVNTEGQLGIGTTTNVTSYTQAITDVEQVWASGLDYRRAAIKRTDGTFWMTGSGAYFANGNPTGAVYSTFTQIDLGGPINKCVLSGTGSYNWTAVLMADGTVKTFGYNGNGVLMTGNTTNSAANEINTVPTGNGTVVDIAGWNQASEQSIAFLMSDGQLLVGGYAASSSIPEDDDENSYVPMPVIF
jgi:alpha-tubulin suppressor-like RCC1 family protein